MNSETYVCQACGIDVVRPTTKGQRPKWCPACRSKTARGPARKCLTCGISFIGPAVQAYCSCSCYAETTRRLKTPRPPRDPAETAAQQRLQWSPLRVALDDGDGAAVIAAIKSDCIVSETGCWIWQRRLRSGYGEIAIAGKYHQVHRLSLEARLGAHLGSQPAHHVCATPACVNPDHLQPVTHRENVAEMLARHAYLDRIRELEAALAECDPSNPLLFLVAVA